MQERRKRAGHLISKHRFIAAQFEAYLADDLWLRLARHANTMAQRLCEGLLGAGLKPIWPVEANEIFVALPQPIEARLRAAGAQFYSWSTDSQPAGIAVPRDTRLVRLVTSFATTAAAVEQFGSVLRAR
jgi:threonine aldolase